MGGRTSNQTASFFIAGLFVVAILANTFFVAFGIICIIALIWALIESIKNKTQKASNKEHEDDSIAILKKTLDTAKHQADQIRELWDPDAEIAICNDCIKTIDQFQAADSKKTELRIYWIGRKSYLESRRKGDPYPPKREYVEPVLSRTIDISQYGYHDWKQDVLDYVAAVDLLSKFKNRYSALQSATFVANVLINGYYSSDQNKGFFDYVKDRCDAMEFSSPSEKLVYDLNGDIAGMLALGENSASIEKRIKSELDRFSGFSRPKPEEIYPIKLSDNNEMNEFAELAKTIAHLKLKHLHISDSEIDSCIRGASKDYSPRAWKSFSDYFSNAFQFGYLTERRFQRLYYILYNIAQAKLEGLSNEEIIKQLGSLYVIDQKKRQDDTSDTLLSLQTEYEENETLPYYSFTKQEHIIIAVASRVTRALYYHRLYRKTAPITIALINRYHKIPPEDALPEKKYFELSTAMLKREKKQMGGVYDTILHISNYVFSGLDETRVYALIKKEDLQTLLDIRLLSANRNTTTKPSTAQIAATDLNKAITACQIPELAISLSPPVDYLVRSNRGNYDSKEKYYTALISRLNLPETIRAFSEKQRRVMQYILECKKNNVPEISFRALVGSRFPGLYSRHIESNKGERTKGKRTKR